jgi:hypothetical protein
MEIIALWLGVALGGINLAFVLKIIFNDLRHLHNMMWQHLRDHSKENE